MEVKQTLLLALKGLMMGAADAVPGVSGGTVAFMTGIYEELILALKNCGDGSIRVLRTEGVAAAWKHIHGTFLLVLMSGILTSLLGFSHAVLFLLKQYPEMVWSFFFGLILASSWLVSKFVSVWDRNTLSFFAVGVVVAYLITSMAPASIDANLFTFFISGSIAICAMILPGISGSFILLLLGMYAPVMGAIKELDLLLLAVFGLGCGIGLLSFSRVLSWMFDHYHHITLALLGGFMLGSLNKVWPWKYTLSYSINSRGEEIPLMQENLWPSNYELITGHSSYLVPSICLMILGAVLVVLLERCGRSSIKD